MDESPIFASKKRFHLLQKDRYNVGQKNVRKLPLSVQHMGFIAFWWFPFLHSPCPSVRLSVVSDEANFVICNL